MSYILWLGAFVIYVVSVLAIYLHTKKKYSVVNLTEINAMLSDILEANFKNSSLSNAAQSILIVLKRFYNIDYVTILIHQDGTNTLEVISSNAGNTHLDALERYSNEAYRGIGAVSAKVLQCDEGTLPYDSADERGVSFSNFTPLTYQGKTIGAILLENKTVATMSNESNRAQLYDKVFKSTALVLQSVLYTENLIKMTSTDQLTGVYNRRFIDMTLGEQLAIHRNLGLSFSVALLDIDFFKKFNDTYGHAYGDLVLKEVAKFIKQSLGENSWIARYGGEEFVIFFGRSNATEVYQKVESIRQGLENLKLSDGTTETSVTASFGVATFPKLDGSVNDLIEKADALLYESKRAGRNKVSHS
jgi:two-component system cell cycle response regulator